MSALEIGQVGIEKGKMRPASVPGELTLTEETLRRLELPNEIRPEQVLNFLKQQSAKLNEIQYREPLKTASADIPPPPMAAAEEGDAAPLTEHELEALQMFAQDVNRHYGDGAMGAQGTDGEGDMTETMGTLIEYLRAKYGEVETTNPEAQSGDIIDWFMMSEIDQQSSELDEKWQEIMAQLTKGGKASPEAIIMAMTEYFGEKYGSVLRKAIRTFSDRVETHQKFVADLGLSEGKTLSATELQQASAEQQANMMDSQMAMQTIQALKQQIDKVQNLSKSELDAYHTGQREVIRNVRAT